ncbi:MAG: PAS domain S-box protein [Mariniphaga sp.]
MNMLTDSGQVKQQDINQAGVVLQEKLIASEVRYRRLFESAKDGILILDAETGRIKDVNPYLSELLGYSQEQFIEKKIWEIGFFKDIAANQEKFYELQNRQYVRYENLPLETATGKKINVEFVSNLYFVNKKKVIQCNIRDITIRKEVERALQESEERYHAIFDSSLDAILLTTPDGRILDVNASACLMFGRAIDDIKLIGRDGILDKLNPNLSMAIETRNQTGKLDSVQLTCVRKSGQKFPAEVTSSIFHDKDGNARTSMIIRDVTDRMLIEGIRKKSDSYTKALLDAIPDLMFRLNRQGVYLDYKAAKDDLAYVKESIIGKKNSDMMSPEFSALIDEKIRVTLDTGKMVEFGYDLDLPVKGKCEFEARMVGCGNDEVVVIVRDVTERKKAEEIINLKSCELQKVSAEKDKFFSIIAHDLRGPFNGFLGFTQILVEELPNLTIDEIREMAIDLKTSAINLYRLLENLLEWSLMQRGFTEFKPQSIFLKSKIDECIRSLFELFQKKGIMLEINVPEGMTVIADANMLCSTIRNLASNALKFTKKGGLVTISALPVSDRLVRISIHDSGIGMNRQILDNLFHIDQKTNRLGTDREPSTGLGLFLCKDFVEKNGGDLTVESEEGKGSTFSFTVPISNI